MKSKHSNETEYRAGMFNRNKGFEHVKNIQANAEGVINTAGIELEGIIIFPNMISPIFISKNRDLAAIKKAQEKNQTLIGLIKRKIKEKQDSNLYLKTGIEIAIGSLLEMPDGTHSALVQGRRRVKILNTLDENGFYLHDYAIAEAFAEVKLKDVWGKPLKLATTFAYNTAVSSNNFGYDLSMQLGETKNNYDWKIGYTYRDIQRDAVFGAHNDSDFIAGGTDGKGHIITAKMKIAKHLDIGGHFQWATLHTDSAKTDADYHRIQLDAILKF